VSGVNFALMCAYVISINMHCVAGTCLPESKQGCPLPSNRDSWLHLLLALPIKAREKCPTVRTVSKCDTCHDGTGSLLFNQSSSANVAHQFPCLRLFAGMHSHASGCPSLLLKQQLSKVRE